MDQQSVLVDPSDVEKFAVADHEGNLHHAAAHHPRPMPFCIECRKEVTALWAFEVARRILFVVACHGERDVVHFEAEGTTLTALVCFRDDRRARKRMMDHFAPWMERGLD